MNGIYRSTPVVKLIMVHDHHLPAPHTPNYFPTCTIQPTIYSKWKMMRSSPTKNLGSTQFPLTIPFYPHFFLHRFAYSTLPLLALAGWLGFRKFHGFMVEISKWWREHKETYIVTGGHHLVASAVVFGLWLQKQFFLFDYFFGNLTWCLIITT